MTQDFEVANGDARLRVRGLSKTLRALSEAGADAEDMKSLMHRIGTLVVRAATPPVLTGRLASTMRAGKGKTKAVVRAGGARAPYAGVVHYGWPAKNKPPNEFMTEALNRRKGAVLSELNEGLGDILTKNNLK